MNDSPAQFTLGKYGLVKAVKLLHVHGMVSCFGSKLSTYWGCKPNIESLGVVLTNSDREIIYPPYQQVWFNLPNYGAFSKEVVFDLSAEQYYGKKGESLFIWYAEDINDESEDGNEGETCLHVDILY